MISVDLISRTFPSLTFGDTKEKAKALFIQYKTTCLPVVTRKRYSGLLKETDIIGNNDLSEKIDVDKLRISTPFAYQEQHVLEVIKIMATHQLELLPIIDSHNTYFGVVTAKNIFRCFATTDAIFYEGCIITLEIDSHNYSLHEIAKLVESNDAKILLSYIRAGSSAPHKLEVTLKINKTEVTQILETFERFNYTILMSYNESEYYKNLKNRYNELMHFLNIQ